MSGAGSFVLSLGAILPSLMLLSCCLHGRAYYQTFNEQDLDKMTLDGKEVSSIVKQSVSSTFTTMPVQHTTVLASQGEATKETLCEFLGGKKGTKFQAFSPEGSKTYHLLLSCTAVDSQTQGVVSAPISSSPPASASSTKSMFQHVGEGFQKLAGMFTRDATRHDTRDVQISIEFWSSVDPEELGKVNIIQKDQDTGDFYIQVGASMNLPKAMQDAIDQAMEQAAADLGGRHMIPDNFMTMGLMLKSVQGRVSSKKITCEVATNVKMPMLDVDTTEVVPMEFELEPAA